MRTIRTAHNIISNSSFKLMHSKYHNNIIMKNTISSNVLDEVEIERDNSFDKTKIPI